MKRNRRPDGEGATGPNGAAQRFFRTERRQRGFRRRSRRPQTWSPERRFGIAALLALLTFLTGLRYIPGHFLLNIEWLVGNQLFRLGLIIPAVIMLILLLRARRYLLAAWAAVPLMVLIVEGFANTPLLPRRSVLPAPPESRLRVMTFNTGVSWPTGLFRYMVANDIDLVCLQEVHSAHLDSLLAIANRNGYDGNLLPLRDDAGGGVLLLYRGRLDTMRVLEAMSFGGMMRRFSIADISFGKHKVRVIGVHLESNSRKRGLSGFVDSWNLRLGQAKLLAETVDTTRIPLMVIGDMNATPTDRSIRPLRQRLRDSWLDSGFLIGGTWDNDHPYLRIDQVLYRGFAGSSGALVLQDLQNSDHLAYRVDLLWPDSGAAP